MSESKYSVLFMRDDASVKRYRIRPFWLKFFFWFQLLLVAVACGGAWVGYTFWQERSSLIAEKIDLEQHLHEAEIQLERLDNIQKILKSYDPRELQSLLSATPSEEPAPPKQPDIDLNQIFTHVDTREVKVDNLQARHNGSNVTLSFELNNLQTSKQLAGVVDISLFGTDGKQYIPQTNRNDLVFQIQRFKRIRTSFNLPKELSKDSVFGVRLEIKGSQGEMIFRETYPMYNILS